MRLPILLISAASLAAASLPASACSLSPDYRAPTNFELTGKADTIVLAKVIGGKVPDDDSEEDDEGTLTIRPLATLKGDPSTGDIALRGMMPLSHKRYLSLSNPYEFSEAHPLSNLGACIRYMFPLGTTALFFLRSDHEGMWAPVWEPYSRWAEDVPSADAPWVRLVELYVRAGGLPEAEGKALLERERAALASKEDDLVAQLMAADIARQLAEPSEEDEEGEDAY